MKPKEPSQHVFRDLIEEQRDGYTLTYQPADARSLIAVLSLYFADSPTDRTKVVQAMEEEFEHWLKKFPVPIKVSAYNTKKRLIRLSQTSGENQLMGYVRLFDEAIVRRWGVIEEREIPSGACEPEYLEESYKGVPFRIREEDRVMAKLAFRYKAKAIAGAIVLVLGIPALTQAVVHWGQELAFPVMLVSAAVGAYKGMGILGWRKPSKREERKADLFALKEHYFFHCEKNPRSFERLERENEKREVSRENREAKRLLQNVAVRKRKVRRGSWIAMPRLFRRRLAGS